MSPADFNKGTCPSVEFKGLYPCGKEGEGVPRAEQEVGQSNTHPPLSMRKRTSRSHLAAEEYTALNREAQGRIDFPSVSAPCSIYRN